MKIGVVASSISHQGGGVTEVVRGQCAAIARTGYSVEVFAPKDQGDRTNTGSWDGVKVRTLPAAWSRFAWAPEMSEALLSADVDVVHLHGLWNAVSYSVLQWSDRSGRPVIISPHGMLDPWALSRSKWKKRAVSFLFESRNLTNAACFHALNTAEAIAIRSVNPDTPIAILPNGIDLPDLDGHSRSVPATRKTMLFLGRLHPKKGLNETITAWHRFKQCNPALAQRWQLVIAGWGDPTYEAELRGLVSELGLTADVTFAGAVFGSQKDALLRNADAFVLASFSEGLPMAILEAWAYSLPVLATPACNLPVGFEFGAAQRISNDVGELAMTLVDVLGRDDVLENMGRKGRELAAEQFSWAPVGVGLIKTYSWLTGHGGRPDFVLGNIHGATQFE